jgi:ABC-type phosphate/phosphonate transport system substrate-binding protein
MAGRPEGGTISAAKLIRGLRFAFNERHSMSGYLALARDLAKSGIIAEEAAFPAFWSAMVETQAHRASVLAVAEGRADVAAIDCRTWAYCRRYEPAAAALAVIGWTAPRMGLPFITAKDSPLKKL